jgi:hypothetical protein
MQHDKLAVPATTAVTVVRLQLLLMRGLAADLPASQTACNAVFAGCCSSQRKQSLEEQLFGPGRGGGGERASHGHASCLPVSVGNVLAGSIAG